MTSASAADTNRRKITRARALFASGFSLFGRQSSYPGRIAPASMALESMASARRALDPIAGSGSPERVAGDAGGGTRTPMLFRAPAPKAGVSTKFHHARG